MIERERAELSISVGRVFLSSPFVISAGPWSAGDELTSALAAEIPAAGAVVCKTVTLQARAGNPPPTVRIAAGGLLNRIGLRNPGVTIFVAEQLPRLLMLGVPVLISVAAPEPGELGELIAELERSTDPDQVIGYELNASCPNINGDPPEPAQLRALVNAARRQTTRSLWVKLGYAERSLLCQRAKACATGGADAIVAINTVPAMAVAGFDSGSALPVLEEALVPFLGGLSGACLHPLALRAVWELTHSQPLPVIGCGGVQGLREALAFFAAGAQAIQLGSVLYPSNTGIRHSVLAPAHAELVQYLGRRGFSSLVAYLKERE